MDCVCCQVLRDQIQRLTASHAAALEQQRLQQKEKKRETHRLFASTDELQCQIKVWSNAAYFTKTLFVLNSTKYVFSLNLLRKMRIFVSWFY